MPRIRQIAIAVLAAGAAVLVGAGKPAPAPTPFDPQVVYRYNASNYTDIRLGDGSGSAASLLYRSTNYIGGYDAAPASAKAVVFIEGTSTPSNRLLLATWTQDSVTGAISVATPRVLYESRALLYPDFSPDGSKIAFDESNQDGTYSLRVIDVATGSVTTVAIAPGGPAYLRWSSTGDALYYAIQHAVTGQTYTSAYAAYRQPTNGGSPIFMFEKPNIERWDISRDGTDSLILNYSAPETGQSIPFAVWNGTTLTQVYSQLIGYQPHFTCGNAKMIYQSYSKTGVRGPTKVYTPASTSDVIYSRDNNVAAADWIPCG